MHKTLTLNVHITPTYARQWRLEGTWIVKYAKAERYDVFKPLRQGLWLDSEEKVLYIEPEHWDEPRAYDRGRNLSLNLYPRGYAELSAKRKDEARRERALNSMPTRVQVQTTSTTITNTPTNPEPNYWSNEAIEARARKLREKLKLENEAKITDATELDSDEALKLLEAQINDEHEHDPSSAS